MKQASELERLESFVSSLLARYNELKEDNAKLSQDVTDKDGIIEDLRGSLAVLESERSEISNRVGGIIEQIEQWEKINPGSVEQKTSAENSEGRMQTSLFSFEPGSSKGSTEHD